MTGLLQTKFSWGKCRSMCVSAWPHEVACRASIKSQQLVMWDRILNNAGVNVVCPSPWAPARGHRYKCSRRVCQNSISCFMDNKAWSVWGEAVKIQDKVIPPPQQWQPLKWILLNYADVHGGCNASVFCWIHLNTLASLLYAAMPVSR